MGERMFEIREYEDVESFVVKMGSKSLNLSPKEWDALEDKVKMALMESGNVSIRKKVKEIEIVPSLIPVSEIPQLMKRLQKYLTGAEEEIMKKKKEYISYGKLMEILAIVPFERGEAITSSDVAEKLGFPPSVANRGLRILAMKGLVDVEKRGRKKFYWRTTKKMVFSPDVDKVEVNDCVSDIVVDEAKFKRKLLREG